MAVKVWRGEKGELFHDSCFEEGESKEGYKQVSLDDLEEDDSCETCGGEFVSGPADDSDDDDDEE